MFYFWKRVFMRVQRNQGGCTQLKLVKLGIRWRWEDIGRHFLAPHTQSNFWRKQIFFTNQAIFIDLCIPPDSTTHKSNDTDYYIDTNTDTFGIYNYTRCLLMINCLILAMGQYYIKPNGEAILPKNVFYEWQGFNVYKQFQCLWVFSICYVL